MSFYLTNTQIFEIADAIRKARLDSLDSRNTLVMGIAPGYIAGLPERDSRSDQVLSDLNEMNQTPFLDGGEVPLQIYLSNCFYRARAASLPQKALFEKYLNLVGQKSEEALRADHNTAPATSLEKIIHESDLLDFTWIRRALELGGSVARLTVPRFEDGIDTGKQVHGTAWLIGPSHIITNHHVINARGESEPVASPKDLESQALGTIVEFDCETAMLPTPQVPPAPPESAAIVKVRALKTVFEWNHNPEQLDFAILELDGPPPPGKRTPFTLGASLVAGLEGAQCPVNIIQHPGGERKSIALRNNLTSAKLGANEIRYFTDTLQGSSGSPVCDDQWRVIALHRASYRFIDPVNFQGKSTAWANRGVRIDRIVEYLQKQHPGLLASIGARVI